MISLRHTVSFAAVPVVTVYDDRGDVVHLLSLPICLILYLPAACYTALLAATGYWPSAVGDGLSAYLAGWQADLQLIYLAARLLVIERKFHQS